MTKVELLSNNYPHFINSALAATNEGGGHKFYEDTIIKHRNQLEWRYCPQILYQKKFGDMCYVDCWWRDTVMAGGYLVYGVSTLWNTSHLVSTGGQASRSPVTETVAGEVRVRFQSSPSSHRFTNYRPAKVIKETIL